MPRRPPNASSRAPQRPRKRPQRNPMNRPLLIGAAIVVAAGIWFELHRAPARPPATEAQGMLPFDSLKVLAGRVVALQAAGRYGESLPGARALLEQHSLHGRLVPEMLVDYGRMLNNAAFEGGSHAPRSSFE